MPIPGAGAFFCELNAALRALPTFFRGHTALGDDLNWSAALSVQKRLSGEAPERASGEGRGSVPDMRGGSGLRICSPGRPAKWVSTG